MSSFIIQSERSEAQSTLPIFKLALGEFMVNLNPHVDCWRPEIQLLHQEGMLSSLVEKLRVLRLSRLAELAEKGDKKTEIQKLLDQIDAQIEEIQGVINRIRSEN